MFKFTLDVGAFLKLQRRLVGVAASDKDATVNFTLEGSDLTVRYKSKLGRSETSSLFLEKLSTLKAENTGSSTVRVQELLGIKMEPYSKEGKFPFSREVSFNFQNSVLKTSWEVQHSETQSSKVNLAHAILKNMPDLSEFSKLEEDRETWVELSSADLQETIAYCNLFKADATSRGSNGCLFEVSGEKLISVGTDSIVASKFEVPITGQNLKDPFKLVIDNTVLVFIKTFTSDVESVKLSPTKRFLFVESSGRCMCVPLMNVKYNIQNPEDFFKVDSPFLGTIDSPPIIGIMQTLTYLSTDVHSKVELDLKEGKLNIRTSKNSTEDLPCDLVQDALIKVNSGLFLTGIKKIDSFCKQPVQIFFNEKNRRIMLSSPQRELVFLIQGMRD